MNFESLGFGVIYTGLVIILLNHIIFKYFVLKRIHDFHNNIWIQLGSPTVFSLKESMWVLIGMPNEINIREMVRNDISGEQTISMLNRYRISTVIEFIVIFCGIIILLW